MPIDRLFRFIISLFLIVTAVPFLASETIAQQDEAGTSSIEVLKRLCPPGYDGANFFEDCPDPQADVQFSLDGLQTTTDAEGSAVFFDLGEGMIQITEDTMPADQVLEYVVYCRLAEDPDAAIDFDYVEAGPTGAAIELNLPAQTDIICGWYNIEVEEMDSTVRIHHRICPPDYDGGNFAEDCTNIADPPLPFELSNGVQREQQTDQAGNVSFTGLPSGTYTIIGGAPGHAADLAVSCVLPDGSPHEIEGLNGGIELFLPEQTRIDCDWYNVPIPLNGQSSVEVLKRVCPPEYDGDDYFGECDEPQADVQFGLDGRQGTTDAAGSALFPELTEGTYTITEDTLSTAEYGYWVYCRLAEDVDAVVEFDYVEAGATGAGIELFVDTATDIICGWYNIPEPMPDPTPTVTPAPPTPTPTVVPDDTSSVEILKRVCPPGYQGDNFFEDCDEPQADVEFGFDGLEASTDAQGRVLFFDLNEGTFTITENSLALVEYDFWVYCRLAEDVDAVVDFDYLEAGPTGSAIEIFVEADTDIVCGWYNIPVPMPDPTPTATVTPAPPTPTPTAVPPTPTPTPPLELAIHPVTLETGSCLVPGELVVALNDAELREGEEIGFPGPVGVAESVTRLNATIDQLTDQEFIIVVYRSPEEADEVIACGQIGGVPREMDDGGFAIRLGQVEESGALGIADIAPVDDLVDVEEVLGDDEPTIVEITVYLTLIEDDPESAGAAS